MKKLFYIVLLVFVAGAKLWLDHPDRFEELWPFSVEQHGTHFSTELTVSRGMYDVWADTRDGMSVYFIYTAIKPLTPGEIIFLEEDLFPHFCSQIDGYDIKEPDVWDRLDKALIALDVVIISAYLTD